VSTLLPLPPQSLRYGPPRRTALLLSRLCQGLVEGGEIANYHCRRTWDSLLGIGCPLVTASMEHDPVAEVGEN
jgi:hypothetical protein